MPKRNPNSANFSKGHLQCPQCGSTDHLVLETRFTRFSRITGAADIPLNKKFREALQSSSATGVRRRRVCPACNYRWSTLEISTEHLNGVCDALHKKMAAKEDELLQHCLVALENAFVDVD